jgi:exosortase
MSAALLPDRTGEPRADAPPGERGTVPVVRLTPARCAAAAALAAVGVLAMLPSWADIVRMALRDAEQSHVLLVPFVAGWLVWVRRERLRKSVVSGTWAGPLLIAAGWVMNYAGERLLIESAWHLGAIVVAVGGFVAVAGVRPVLALKPVLVCLLFLVPVPGLIRQQIALPLQTATAEVTRSALETFGCTVERSGNLIRLDEQDIVIAEACNGLRMVFALLFVSYAFAWGVPLRTPLRMAVLVATPVTAIAFNVARLVPVVWAHGSLPSDAAQALHDVSGWVMLPCAFLTLMAVMRLVRWAQVPIAPYVLAHGA